VNSHQTETHHHPHREWVDFWLTIFPGYFFPLPRDKGARGQASKPASKQASHAGKPEQATTLHAGKLAGRQQASN